MGYNNGYDSGYQDATLELMPKIRALEAKLASKTTPSAGPGKPTASPTSVVPTPPSLSTTGVINPEEDLPILLHNASELVELAIKLRPSENFGPPWVYVGADYYIPSENTLVRHVWDYLGGLGNSFSPNDEVQFRFFWKANGDPDGMVHMTDSPVYTMGGES